METNYTERQLKCINNPNVLLVDHPLVQHKLTMLRRKETTISDFRHLLKEITTLMAYEVSKEVPLEPREIETPLEKMIGSRIQRNKIVLVPILRAGLAFEEALIDLFPNANIGHLGMYRDEETLKPHVYLEKMPRYISEARVLIVDPMLATGGSINMAVDYLRSVGVKGTIGIMVLVSAPEGIEAVLEHDDDVSIVTAAVDRELNDKGYILPGLGDAGDRIFGTE